jgi:hypothetical protein
MAGRAGAGIGRKVSLVWVLHHVPCVDFLLAWRHLGDYFYGGLSPEKGALERQADASSPLKD